MSVGGRKWRAEGVRIRWMVRRGARGVREVRIWGSLRVAMEPVQARRRCFLGRGAWGGGAWKGVWLGLLGGAGGGGSMGACALLCFALLGEGMRWVLGGFVGFGFC